jgi:hypothetical protein
MTDENLINYVIVFAGIGYVVLAMVAAGIADRKGRSGCGWLILTLLFPIAIVFVAIASREDADKSEEDSESELSASGKTRTSTRSDQRDPTLQWHAGSQAAEEGGADGGFKSFGKGSGDSARPDLDWATLEKYDPKIIAAIQALAPFGQAAVDEFRRVYSVVRDPAAISHIAETIKNEIEREGRVLD